MPPKLLALGIGSVAVVAVGAIFVSTQMNKDESSNTDETETSNNTSTSNNSKIKLDDPEGVYNQYSDESIITPIETNTVIGGGKVLSVEYDRSKGDKLFYDLYYIQSNGKVQPMGGGVFFTEEGNVFSQEMTIYDSLAVESGHGFIELTTVSDDLKNVKLGMYMVEFVE